MRQSRRSSSAFVPATVQGFQFTTTVAVLVWGEITLLIGRPESQAADSTPIEDAVEACVREGMSRMDAIREVAWRRGIPKREVYRLARLGKSRPG